MYLRPSEAPCKRFRRRVHITLDWSNRQSHRLYEDRRDLRRGLEWREDFMREPAPGQQTRSARSSARSRPSGRKDCPREPFVSGRKRERRSGIRPCGATSS
jgi:hypothetical protein